jgi:hypothetical protein
MCLGVYLTQDAFVCFLGKADPDGAKEVERLLKFATEIVTECGQRQGSVTVNGASGLS